MNNFFENLVVFKIQKKKIGKIIFSNLWESLRTHFSYELEDACCKVVNKLPKLHT